MRGQGDRYFSEGTGSTNWHDLLINGREIQDSGCNHSALFFHKNLSSLYLVVKFMLFQGLSGPKARSLVMAEPFPFDLDVDKECLFFGDFFFKKKKKRKERRLIGMITPPDEGSSWGS